MDEVLKTRIEEHLNEMLANFSSPISAFWDLCIIYDEVDPDIIYDIVYNTPGFLQELEEWED